LPELPTRPRRSKIILATAWPELESGFRRGFDYVPDRGDFLVERLHAWGVKKMFGYPGDGINGVFGALNRAILVGAGALHATDEMIAVADRLQAGAAKALLGKAALPDDLP